MVKIRVVCQEIYSLILGKFRLREGFVCQVRHSIVIILPLHGQPNANEEENLAES